MALTRDAIVAAGLEILDRYGLGDLSMRRVAESLGVQAGALYYHVPNKQSLLAAVSDEILAAVPAPEVSNLGEALTAWAGGLRRALLAHRDAAELVASALAFGLGRADPAAECRAILDRAGSPRSEATAAALLHFVLGHVMEEQTRAQMAELGLVEGFDHRASDADFDWGVGIFVAGVSAS